MRLNEYMSYTHGVSVQLTLVTTFLALTKIETSALIPIKPLSSQSVHYVSPPYKKYQSRALT
jgi:hypothetical protein